MAIRQKAQFVEESKHLGGGLVNDAVGQTGRMKVQNVEEVKGLTQSPSPWVNCPAASSLSATYLMMVRHFSASRRTAAMT